MVILTSGETTKNYFIQIPYIIEKKIEVMTAGSLKYIPQTNSDGVYKSLDRTSILFLPEANYDSFFESVDTMHILSADMTNVQFVIRKHPSLRISKKCLSKLLSDFSFNETLSNLELAKEFERSSLCIFRSSAAAIEGISFGVMPIHMNFSNRLDLNPFSEEITGIKLPQAYCIDELRSYISNYLETRRIGNDNHYSIHPSASELYFGNSLESEFADWIK